MDSVLLLVTIFLVMARLPPSLTSELGLPAACAFSQAAPTTPTTTATIT